KPAAQAQQAAPASEPEQVSEAPAAETTSSGMASVPPERHSPTEAYAETDVPLRNLPHASPSVRKFARELGVNLAAVAGSGAKNRMSKEDVQKYVKSAVAAGGGTAVSAVGGEGGLSVLAWPKVDFGKFGSIETKPLSRIKKISG